MNDLLTGCYIDLIKTTTRSVKATKIISTTDLHQGDST